MDEVRSAVARGLNAIEIDINSDEDGELYVSHYGVTPLRRALPVELPPRLVPFLNELKAFVDSPQGAGLALVILDCKIGEPQLAAELHSKVRAHLTEGGTALHVIVSISSLELAPFFAPLQARLSEHEALMIDEEDDPHEVAEFFARAGVARAAYGNGVTTVAGVSLASASLITCMDRAVALRSLGRLGFVYPWVLVGREMIEECLRIGVSGVMVDADNAEELTGVLDEPPFASELRRAERGDDPLALHDSLVLAVRTGDGVAAGTAATVTFSLRLVDGTLVSKSVRARHTRFERATTTYVTFTGLAVAPELLGSITVSHDGAGILPSWRLASISAQFRAAESRHARFDCEIPPGATVTAELSADVD
jgi:hypothetical protein